MAVGDPERERLRVTLLRQLAADRLLDRDHVLDDTLGDRSQRVVAGLLLGRERLGDLAVVAVDRDRLEPEVPGVDVHLLELLDRRLLGDVAGLADRSADERLHRAHHRDVPHVVDRVVAHRAGEHREMLRVEPRRADDRLVLVDVGDDLVHLLARVPEPAEGAGHGLVDDEHRAPTDQLLRLREREVRLDAGRVAVEGQGDRPGRRQHGGLRVPHPVALTE